MFVRHAFAGNLAVIAFLFAGQLLFLSALDRMLGIGVNFLDSLVTRVEF